MKTRSSVLGVVTVKHRRRAMTFLAALALPLLGERPFGERIEVNVTNIDVVVTDRAGAHVRGLAKEDFEVLDNGVPQNLTNLSEVRGGASNNEAAPTTTGESNDTYKPPVNLLLFVDNQHLQLKTRARVIEALQRFLDAHKDKELRAIVLRFNGGHSSKPLAGDAASVARDLPAFLESEPPNQLKVRSERRHFQELIDGSRDSDQALGPVIAWAGSVRNDNMRTLGALRSAIGAMSGFDGRKILLFVSEGIPQRAGMELFRHWGDKFRKNPDLQSMEFDMSRELGEVTRLANASGVSLYTVNALGTNTEDFEMDGGLLPRDARELRDSRQGALDFLAGQTGGVPIRNQNVFDTPLASIADDFHDYYSLGYRTPVGKSATHKIEVRVKKPGLRARTAQEYAVLSAAQKASSRVEAMFVIPPADANPLGVVLARKEAEGSGSTRVVPILIRVPRERLTTVTGGHVTLFLAVMDSDGARTPVRSLPLEVPKEGDVVQLLELTMRKGTQTLVAGARDDVSGTLSLVRMEVTNN